MLLNSGIFPFSSPDDCSYAGFAQKKPAVETAGDLTIACYMNLF